MLRAAWKILFAAVLVTTIGLAHLVVPGIVPIAFAEEPQPSWAVMTAFFLRAIELMAGSVAMIALAVIAGVLIQRRVRARQS